MATGTIFFYITFAVSIMGSDASMGQFVILSSAPSVKFSPSTLVREAMIQEIFAAALGLSTDDYSYWDGLHITDPFETPEAVVLIYIDGMNNLGDFGQNAIVYQMTAEDKEPEIFEAMNERIGLRNRPESKLVNLRLLNTFNLNNYANVFGDLPAPKIPKLPLTFLKYSIEEDYMFLSEVETLKSIGVATNQRNIRPDNNNDFFCFKFNSLYALSQYHGLDSLQTEEAKRMLTDQVKQLNNAFAKAYDGSVVFAVVTTEMSHTRRLVRQAEADPPEAAPPEAAPPEAAPPEAATPPPSETSSHTAAEEKQQGESRPQGKGASPTDDDFPVIFNIIAGFCMAWMFSMYSIVYVFMNMDPGRDSIIYRMTSTKIKNN